MSIVLLVCSSALSLYKGNPWTVASIDNRAATDFWFSHGVVSAAAWDGMKAYCDFSEVGPLREQEATTGSRRSSSGGGSFDSASSLVSLTSFLFLYFRKPVDCATYR
jgi:hypothetical protein